MKLPQYTYILIQFNTVASTAPFNCGQRNTLTQYRKIFCVLLQNQKYCQIYRLTSQFTSYRNIANLAASVFRKISRNFLFTVTEINRAGRVDFPRQSRIYPFSFFIIFINHD